MFCAYLSIILRVQYRTYEDTSLIPNLNSPYECTTVPFGKPALLDITKTVIGLLEKEKKNHIGKTAIFQEGSNLGKRVLLAIL